MSKYRYLITAFLLLILFGVRLFRLDALPFFIDESILVRWSEQVRNGNPLTFGYDGRYLVPWLLALFDPAAASPFIPRVFILLWILPGAAAVVTISKRLHSWHSSWLALILIILNPMLHFHDRLALTDTVLHSMLTLLTLFLLWTFDKQRLNWKLVVLSGAFFVLCVLTKSSAAVILPLPLVAAIILPHTWTLLQRLKGLVYVYGTMLVLWIPFQAVLLWRNIDFWGRAAQGSTSGTLFDIGRILSNIAFVWEGLSGYAHPIYWALIAFGIILALIFKTRYSLYLLAMGFGYAFALILLGDQLYFRYWIPSLPVLLTLAAAGYSYGYEKSLLPSPVGEGLGVRSRNTILAVRFMPIILLMLLGINALPFIHQTYTNPLELPLPHLDRQQYLEADSAGTAIPEVADYLRDTQMPIVGAFPQCYTLQLYLRHEITCLNIAGDDAVRIPRINNELAAIEAPFYLVMENRGYATVNDIHSVNLNAVATFERPGGLIAIVVYEAGL